MGEPTGEGVSARLKGPVFIYTLKSVIAPYRCRSFCKEIQVRDNAIVTDGGVPYIFSYRFKKYFQPHVDRPMVNCSPWLLFSLGFALELGSLTRLNYHYGINEFHLRAAK